MWSLYAGFTTGLEREVWRSFVNHRVSAGVLVSILILALMYIALHRLLEKVSKVYTELGPDRQLVTLHHTIQFIVLGLLFLPMTYLNLSLNFEIQPMSDFRVKMQLLITFMITLIMLYAFELASRYRQPRLLVIIHHLAAYANTLLPIFFLETTMMKAAAVLTYMITFEVVSFAGLIMYRLMPHNRATPHVIMAGVLVMGLSRPLQVLWVVSTFVLSWEHLILWQAVLQLCLTVLFTTLQVYSLKIQVSLWSKSKRKLRTQSRSEPQKVKKMPSGELVVQSINLFPGIVGVPYSNAAELSSTPERTSINSLQNSDNDSGSDTSEV